jgi:hypothetical protein
MKLSGINLRKDVWGKSPIIYVSVKYGVLWNKDTERGGGLWLLASPFWNLVCMGKFIAACLKSHINIMHKLLHFLKITSASAHTKTIFSALKIFKTIEWASPFKFSQRCGIVPILYLHTLFPPKNSVSFILEKDLNIPFNRQKWIPIFLYTSPRTSITLHVEIGRHREQGNAR